jgi:hypothetical protein
MDSEGGDPRLLRFGFGDEVKAELLVPYRVGERGKNGRLL